MTPQASPSPGLLPQPHHPSEANGHPHPSPSPAPVLPPKSKRRGRRLGWLAGLLLFVGAAVAAALTAGPTVKSQFPGLFATARPDLVLHKVRPEFLAVTVVERGTLESAENKDVTCKVKAGSKGTYASTIRWVIDDGSIVQKGQLLMELDDSALQDQYRTQSIAVEKAKAEWVKADEDLTITVKQNQSDIATADAALAIAVLDLDKMLGLRVDPALEPVGAVGGAAATLAERGDFQKRLDEVSGQLKLAEADLDQYRDRSAWAARSVKLGYQTPSQARAEDSKLAGALENVEKLRKQKYVMEMFDRKKELTDLTSKVEVARLKMDQAVRQAKAKENQAESARRTTFSVYQQELEKLRDIEEQIRFCRVTSPQDGMCVYYKEGGNRWGNSTDGMIQQGAQVKEGQKMLRIPDLKRMQVNTKVHEAMVGRIRGDDKQTTGHFEALQAAFLLTPGLGRVALSSEAFQTGLREANRARAGDGRFYDEYVLASPGQGANIRVDAAADKLLKGHVRTVAAVASQQDWMSSDVRVYQTLVTIDEVVEGLKPDMSAEVTIQIDPPKEPVLAVPVQAIVGGAENGAKRKVYVLTPTGPQEREVTTGLFNEKMVEVREGLADGDQVVLNPRVLLGPGAKTREEASEQTRRPGMAGGAGGKGGEKKGGGKAGGPPAGMSKGGGMPGAGGSPGGGGGGPGGARPKQ